MLSCYERRNFGPNDWFFSIVKILKAFLPQSLWRRKFVVGLKQPPIFTMFGPQSLWLVLKLGYASNGLQCGLGGEGYLVRGIA